ncbi:zeta toxin family protein [Streptomyces sp. NBC_01433]|uniref:zeta toxin family protein n=1 Tax=Streptomyces sp. NBC_01433 TaxID=2903864 RepID=UPI00224E4358|nr:zeta toxin family protein [Streptomyces sp. NBC_01433]MCX4682559.1 zeta toxin family protein [Streptomyces sp. NBC_01433]
MSEPEKPPRRLSDEQLADIIREDVLPGLSSLSSQTSPRMVLLGGPQGSRKTTLRPLVAEQLGLSDVLFYDGDDHYAFHPHYDALAREHGVLEAARLCGPDVDVLRAAILNEASTRRLNIMFIGPYTGQEYTLGRVASFRADDYSTELAYTALHPALSQLGVMDRHRQALSDGPGYSFLVSLELQQAIIDGVPAIMTVVEERGLADALHLVDAGGVAFSKYRGPGGTWSPSRPSNEAVEEIRHQPWDPATRQDFLRRREAVAVPAGEDPERWGKRLARVDELAAPMLAPPGAGARVSAQAARKRSTTLPLSRATKKAAPSPTQRPATPPAPGRESSSGRAR